MYRSEDLSRETSVPCWDVQTSPLLNGWCVEFRGVEYYGAKSVIKEFKKKHKKLFEVAKLEN
jgi:hypothetical protein